ncbi:MAG: hypothetical protein R3337_07195, partial [Gammaproteobacteria bacterium]|nr:hypothetical protein [Gammaproteobacteria bacterium]
RAAAYEANLAALRSAVELYRQQHAAYPGAVAATAATCVNGTNETAAAGSASFVVQMTRYTNMQGQACTGTDGTLNGPYIPEIPPNTRIATVADQTKVKIVSAGILDPAPDGTTGWVFDTVTGQLLPNDN